VGSYLSFNLWERLAHAPCPNGIVAIGVGHTDNLRGWMSCIVIHSRCF
jgi:tartrate dehydratase alpha subunit/fumarate hydratase class I-like protein